MAPARWARTSEKISGFCFYFLVMHSRVSSTGPAHQTLHCDDITDFKSLFSSGGKFYRSNTSAAVGLQICLTSWMNTITFKQTTIGRAAEQLLLWTRPPRHSAPRLICRTWTVWWHQSQASRQLTMSELTGNRALTVSEFWTDASWHRAVCPRGRDGTDGRMSFLSWRLKTERRSRCDEVLNMTNKLLNMWGDFSY